MIVADRTLPGYSAHLARLQVVLPPDQAAAIPYRVRTGRLKSSSWRAGGVLADPRPHDRHPHRDGRLRQVPHPELLPRQPGHAGPAGGRAALLLVRVRLPAGRLAPLPVTVGAFSDPTLAVSQHGRVERCPIRIRIMTFGQVTLHFSLVSPFRPATRQPFKSANRACVRRFRWHRRMGLLRPETAKMTDRPLT